MKIRLLFTYLFFISLHVSAQKGILVIQTDFGQKDAAVATMKGVAMQVSAQLRVFDLTHEIPPFNIWEAAYRLEQTAKYWPAGTVFVSVVDPGVGSERKSVVLKTKSGHYFVSPDNGTLTLVSQTLGIAAVREIDEKVNRLKGSADSYTFHGRDVYDYTGARLAAGVIKFEQVGKRLPDSVMRIPFQQPELLHGVINGNIPVLDIQYGNVWTNIPEKLLKEAGVHFGDMLKVTIWEDQTPVYRGILPFVKTFAEVAPQKEMCYVNSLLNLSIAINLGNFANQHHVGSGPEWRIEVMKN